MQKELREKESSKDWGHFSSNYFIIGDWFPLSHYLTGREKARQMWLSWKEVLFRRPDVLWAQGVIPCSRPVICFTPVLISPVINDLVLTQSDLLPLPVLLDKRLAGERCFRSDLQVVTRATYTCFSWCTVHLAAQQDLQFHPSQGAEKGLEGGGCS